MADSQAIRTSLSLAAVGIIGTLLGSALTQYLIRYREHDAWLQEQQRQAYVDYLDGLDKDRMARELRFQAGENRKTASALSPDGRDAAEKAAAVDEAKAKQLETQFQLEGGSALRRMAIYGDKRVVKAFAEFSRQSTSLPPCGPHWKADLNVWVLMREAALGSQQQVGTRDLGELALFCTPQVTE